MLHNKITLVVLAALIGSNALAQEKQSAGLYDLTLDELMNTSIVSASKKSENLFDAPFSASVLTKDEINRAGVTSIMEAFRLMPGLIVRQQTNGNFDVHIRGLDNVPPNGVMVNAASTTALVMIDNRPVYNYLQGGTFWESLPIDLNDVEKIEIVRGAASAMYGPNAVTGVINIITRTPEKEGAYVVANVQRGSQSTSIANTSLGYKVNPKLNFLMSGNYQRRDRGSISYYRPLENDFVNDPAQLEVANPTERYPNPGRSMEKYGFNTFVNYAPSSNVDFSLSTGLQGSEVQNTYAENLFTPISTSRSNTKYADLRTNAFGFSSQVSVLNGVQDPTLGSIGSKYDFTTIDGFLEYALVFNKITIKPGYNFRKAIYDDTPYWNASLNEGVISGRHQINTNAFYVRSDYQASQKLRFFGGARLDHFNNPDKPYFSYQMAGAYNLNENNLIRLVQSRANRSPFIYDTYIGLTLEMATPVPFPPYSYPSQIIVEGNTNVNLVVSDMVELGYRTKLAKNFHLDLDFFGSKTQNYTEMILGETDMSGMATGGPIRTYVNVRNLPFVAEQLGATVAANYILNKLQVKPFITLQQTYLRNYSSYYNSAEANPTAYNPDPASNNYLIGEDVKHKGTPAAFGGAFINYQLTSKFNVNLNPYYFSSNTFLHRDAITYRDGQRGIDYLNSKLLMNAKVSYRPYNQLAVFVTGRNIFNDKSREFYKSDAIGGSVLVGLNYEL